MALLRGVLICGPHGVSALLCLGVSACELPLGIGEGRGAPVLAGPRVLAKALDQACLLFPEATA